MNMQTEGSINFRRIITVMTAIAVVLLTLFVASCYAPPESGEDETPNLADSSVQDKEGTAAEQLEENVESVLNYNYGADASASYITLNSGEANFSVSVNVNDSKPVFGYYLDLTLKEINAFLAENDIKISKFSITGLNQSKDEILMSWDSNDLVVGTLYDYSGDEPAYEFDISAEKVMEYCDYSPEK